VLSENQIVLEMSCSAPLLHQSRAHSHPLQPKAWHKCHKKDVRVAKTANLTF